jgi:hypothetical protein
VYDKIPVTDMDVALPDLPKYLQDHTHLTKAQAQLVSDTLGNEIGAIARLIQMRSVLNSDEMLQGLWFYIQVIM